VKRPTLPGRRAWPAAFAGAAALAGCFPDIPPVKQRDAAPGAGGPVLFLSRDEAAATGARLAEQPWKTAALELEADAAEAFAADPLSVVTDGAPGQGGLHDFGTDIATGTDPHRDDYLAAFQMAHWMRDLAISYAVTGQEAHGARCIELLVAWFVDDATYMAPNAENLGPATNAASEAGSSIEIHLTIPGMLYAASLVWDHPAWAGHPGAKEAIVEWTRQFLASIHPAPGADGWETVAWAAAATFAGDAAAQGASFDNWRALADAIDADGYVAAPSAGLEQSLFALKPLAITAELARHAGVDLYGYEAGGGPALQRAADRYADHLLDLTPWPDPMTGDLGDGQRAEEEAAYELFYSVWRESTHLSVLVTTPATRPFDEIRILGPVTLTHGNRFDLATGGGGT